MSVPVTRRTVLRALAGASLAAAAQGQGQRKPNFVFILADDMGYADLGCYGSGRIKTPNIDRLAREGMRFSDCYANAPVCTPTRVGFLTGRYQQRFGKDLEGALGPANNYTAGLRPSESALPSALKRQGYACGMFGKWHVGANEEFRPLQHGFDEYFGILLGNADIYSHKYHSGVLDLWEGNETVEREGYLTEMFGRRAARFIEQNADRPVFCYLPFNAVHWPFQPPGRPDDIRTRLVEQVTGLLRWTESVQWLTGEGGVAHLAELGTGKVLTGLAKRSAPDANSVSVSSPADVEAFVAEIGA